MIYFSGAKSQFCLYIYTFNMAHHYYLAERIWNTCKDIEMASLLRYESCILSSCFKFSIRKTSSCMDWSSIILFQFPRLSILPSSVIAWAIFCKKRCNALWWPMIEEIFCSRSTQKCIKNFIVFSRHNFWYSKTVSNQQWLYLLKKWGANFPYKV